MDRLGLLDTDVLFREVERLERSKQRDRTLGRGGSRKELERFLGQVSADFAQIRQQAAAASEIRRREDPCEVKVVKEGGEKEGSCEVASERTGSRGDRVRNY